MSVGCNNLIQKIIANMMELRDVNLSGIRLNIITELKFLLTRFILSNALDIPGLKNRVLNR